MKRFLSVLVLLVVLGVIAPQGAEMAEISKEIVRGSDAAGNVITAGYVYDDVQMEIISIWIINNCDREWTISLTSTFNGKNYTFVVPPHTTIDQKIPPGQLNRLRVELYAGGKLAGVEWQVY